MGRFAFFFSGLVLSGCLVVAEPRGGGDPLSGSGTPAEVPGSGTPAEVLGSGKPAQVLGSGSESDPFRLCTAEHLGHLNQYPAAFHEIVCDIDLSTHPINDRTGSFLVDGKSFSGVLDGKNHTLTGFTMRTNKAGLFESVSGTVKNLRFANFNFLVYSEGSAPVAYYLLPTGRIENVHTTGVIESGIEYGGGRWGGIVGINQGYIGNSSATLAIRNGARLDEVGGIAGSSSGVVENSSAVLSVDNLRVEKNIQDGSRNIGGLLGMASGRISNSHANVSVRGGIVVGGLVGLFSNGTIERSYATGLVSGFEKVGGLIGFATSNQPVVLDRTAAAVTVTGKSLVGGLIGHIGPGALSVEIRNSYVHGYIIGSHLLGGLVGLAASGTELTISKSYFKGTITSFPHAFNLASTMGGLVGGAASTVVEDSFVQAKLEGGKVVSGFFGQISYSVTSRRSYFAGTISGIESLYGTFLSGSTDRTFWDSQLSGVAVGAGVGVNTAGMKNPSTFAGFDSASTWQIASGQYPELRSSLFVASLAMPSTAPWPDLSFSAFDGSLLSDRAFANANFSHASLKDSPATNSNFSGANLSYSNLSGIRFTSANLQNADLKGALLSSTNFAGANLSGAKFNTATQFFFSQAFGESLGMVFSQTPVPPAPVPAAIDICTRAELEAIADDMSGHYRLVCDIDLAGRDWQVLGGAINNTGEGQAEFKGSLNGNGHIIRNLRIRQGVIGGLGLFYTVFGQVKNLKLLQVDIEGNECGSLAWLSGPDAEIKDIEVTGSVVGLSHAGGLIAQGGGRISNIRTTVTVRGGTFYAGGIIGEAYSGGLLSNSVAFGDVTAEKCAGGLMGGMWMLRNNERLSLISGMNVESCQAHGNVTALSEAAGGLVGCGSHLIINSSASGQVTGPTSGTLVGILSNGEIVSSSATGTANGATNLVGRLENFTRIR